MKVKTNIQQRNYIFLLCNILLFIISCQKNNEPTICTNKNIVSNFYKLSETEAADIVNNFIDAWNTNIAKLAHIRMDFARIMQTIGI